MMIELTTMMRGRASQYPDEEAAARAAARGTGLLRGCVGNAAYWTGTMQA